MDELKTSPFFIEKIQKKSGMNPLQVGRKSNPLEDLIIHLCIKDALTCRNVIEASEKPDCKPNLPL